jgi:hypothetical protein
MNLVESGLFYLKKGMPVFPFKRDKSSPLVKWEQYQQVFPSPDDVKGWFTKRFSDQFIAIVTGKISRMMVVDCDTPEAYEKVQELLPDGFVCPTVKSPRGWHLYFQFREGLINKAAYMPGVDVRTEGGCIIAPPSMNGNGIGYHWLSGLSLEKIDLQSMPSLLFNTLLQFVNNNARARITDDTLQDGEPQTATQTTNGNNFLTLGRRDQDIFHLATCLAKGGYERELADKILNIIGKNCDPTFDEKDIKIKIESAWNRKLGRERNLAFEVGEWVRATNGNFSTTNCHNELQMTTKDEKKNLNMILKRLSECNPPVIEKAGTKNGEWRLIDNTCAAEDWVNADCDYRDLWLPLGLGEICGVQPGNILIFAGAKDSGKTAFMLNCAKENRHKYKVSYFNSEMGKHEFKLRASKFDDISIKQWNNFSLYNRYGNFQDVVNRGEGNLNVIDYLEAPEEAYKIGPMIKRLHDRLEGAICIMAIQKKIGQDLGRGAEFSMEKARLYVSLDYGKAKIISCKNFKENEIIKGNPRGYSCRYKLFNGCKILKQPPGWANETKEV